MIDDVTVVEYPINFYKIDSTSNSNRVKYYYEVANTKLTGVVYYSSSNGDYPAEHISNIKVESGRIESDPFEMIPPVDVPQFFDGDFENSPYNLKNNEEFPEEAKIQLDQTSLLRRADIETARMITNGLYSSPLDSINSYVAGDSPAYVMVRENGAIKVIKAEEYIPPTKAPTKVPTIKPTKVPTPKPIDVPTLVPTAVPTKVPTQVPTSKPTTAPISAEPTRLVFADPTAVPITPTDKPTSAPTPVITNEPTKAPKVTNISTKAPTNTPTQRPAETKPLPSSGGIVTVIPKGTPDITAIPSKTPSPVPTAVPTAAPTIAPIITNTPVPTQVIVVTNVPTTVPTQTIVPAMTSTAVPTATVVITYTAKPTNTPYNAPTSIPTATATKAPTSAPTASPTKAPTIVPTSAPTAVPTKAPTAAPTNTPNPGLEVPKYPVFANTAAQKYLAICMINHEETISLADFPELLNSKRLVLDLKYAWYQNPYVINPLICELEYIDLQNKCIKMTYALDKATTQRYQDAIYKKAKQVANSIIKPGMDANEKSIAIYEYLEANCSYNHVAMEYSENHKAGETYRKYPNSWNTYGILCENFGVCQSYAYAYNAIASEANLETMMVTGKMKNAPHAWNATKINGKWYIIDPTNNNKDKDSIPYLYVNLGLNEAKNFGYTFDGGFIAEEIVTSSNNPICNDNSQEFYSVYNLYAESISDIAKILAYGSTNKGGKTTNKNITFVQGKEFKIIKYKGGLYIDWTNAAKESLSYGKTQSDYSSFSAISLSGKNFVGYSF
jgi:hypothetical protein